MRRSIEPLFPGSTRSGSSGLRFDGRKARAQIEAAQRRWPSVLGNRIGEMALRRAHAALARVVEGVEPYGGARGTGRGEYEDRRLDWRRRERTTNVASFEAKPRSDDLPPEFGTVGLTP